MKEKIGRVIVKCLYVVLLDISVYGLYCLCATLSNDVPIFAALGYLMLFNGPVLRGVLSYIITKRVWLPNLILLCEILIIPTVLTGGAVLTSSEHMLFIAFIFSISVAASLITAAIVRSRNSQKNTADVPLYKDNTQQ